MSQPSSELAQNEAPTEDPVDMAEQVAAHDHVAHARLRKWLLIGGIGIAAIILAPYILPQFGIAEKAADDVFETCLIKGTNSGIAGFASNALSHVPYLGVELAKGGWMNAIVGGGIGLGGALLGNYLEKRADGSTGIRWGKIIKTVALTTSLFVAIPAIFPGISMGLIYLGSIIAPSAGSALADFFTATLGTVKGASMAAGVGGGLSALAPHLLSCGVSLGAGTASLAANLSSAEKQESPKPLGPHTERELRARSAELTEQSTQDLSASPTH